MMIARLCALVMAAVALAALRAQYDVLPYGPGANNLGERLWVLAGYFTILTNVGVAIAMLAVVKKWRISAAVAAGLVVSITMVGIIYHLVLADLWNPVGLALWANQGLHTAVPLGMVGWWLAFAPKNVGLRDLSGWMLWPLIYCIYATTRGSLTGFWPYPFLDIGSLGVARVGANMLILVVAFASLGIVIIGIARWIGRTRQPAKPS